MTAHYIVTPVKNAIRTIDSTIWSIVSQTGDLDIHYHIQDGVSTDGTLFRIQEWATRLDKIKYDLPSRIHFSYSSEPDQGMYDAINKGFSKLKIDADAFMNWCNADDMLWPGALQALAKLNHCLPNVDWIIGWPSWFNNNNRFGDIERDAHYPQAILANGLADGVYWPFVQQESTFWRKRLWDKSGGVNPTALLAGDWDLWTKFAQLTPLIHVQRQLGAFYERPGQQSSNMNKYRQEIVDLSPFDSQRIDTRLKELPLSMLTNIKIAVENERGDWELSSRSCSLKANMLARVLRRLPISKPSFFILLYKIW